jgi:LysM repeat protein
MRSRLLPLVVAGALSAVTTLTTLTPSAYAADEVIVGSGDTLSAIAAEHGTTVERLVSLNHLADPNRIYVGQRLRIKPRRAPAARPAPPAPRPKPRIHVVGAGEHLTGIARRYHSTVAAIARLNRIANPSFIRVGQRLKIPGVAVATVAARPAARPAPPAPRPKPRIHVVGAGEHLTGIARRYHSTVAAIARLNRIANPSFIRVGQRLKIPTAVPSAAAASGVAMPASMAAAVGRRASVGRLLAAEATRLGVPVALAKAVAWQESGWRQGVTSDVGAIGVMQLMPGTAAWIGEAMLGARVDPHDLRQNVRAGVRLLRHYLDRYHGDRALVLAAYYQGQRAVDQHGIYAVSRPYIASVRALERVFGGR